MANVTIASDLQADQYQISPDYVRISMAAAIELGMPIAPIAVWRASDLVHLRRTHLSVLRGHSILLIS